MRVPRTAVVYVAVWVGVVVACSVLAWAVISRAGEGVVNSDELPERSPSTSTPRITVPAPTLSPTGSPGTSPSSPGPTATDPSTPPPSSPASVPVQRTWSGQGGVVVVECRSTAAGLVSARPDPGFAVEVDDTGPGRVEVEFEGNDGDARTRVRAECVNGEPVFEIDSD